MKKLQIVHSVYAFLERFTILKCLIENLEHDNSIIKFKCDWSLVLRLYPFYNDQEVPFLIKMLLLKLKFTKYTKLFAPASTQLPITGPVVQSWNCLWKQLINQMYKNLKLKCKFHGKYVFTRKISKEKDKWPSNTMLIVLRKHLLNQIHKIKLKENFINITGNLITIRR